MLRIVIYDSLESLEVVNSIEDVLSLDSCDLYGFEYTKPDGKGSMNGINVPFIVTDTITDVSTITANQVQEFLKGLKIEEFKKQNEANIEEGFVYNGDVFGFDKIKDQTNFTQATTMISFKKTKGMDTTARRVQWKTENNGVKEYTEDEFFEICLASEKHKWANIDNYRYSCMRILSNNYDSLESLRAETMPEPNREIILSDEEKL